MSRGRPRKAKPGAAPRAERRAARAAELDALPVVHRTEEDFLNARREKLTQA